MTRSTIASMSVSNIVLFWVGYNITNSALVPRALAILASKAKSQEHQEKVNPEHNLRRELFNLNEVMLENQAHARGNRGISHQGLRSLLECFGLMEGVEGCY